MNIDELLKSPPKVHNWTNDGQLTSSGLPEAVFRFMDKVLTPQTKSVETGAGISTVLFALKGCNHTCVNPDDEENQRLKEFCKENGVSTDNVTFVAKKSNDSWYELKDQAWDFVLVDGCHGFPTSIVDFYFLSLGLKINGYLIIDDTHIITCALLKDFLITESAWKLVEPFNSKTAIFQKVAEYDAANEWIRQPYVVTKTKELEDAKKPLSMDFASRAKRKLIRILS